MKSIINKSIEEKMVIIRDIENLKECLEVRLALIGQDYAHKNEFEQNESDILRMKTEIQLNKLNLELEKQNHEFITNFYFYIDELEEESES